MTEQATAANENIEDNSFGEKMVQWRENAGLTRKDFARKLNVSLTAVKNWKLVTPPQN